MYIIKRSSDDKLSNMGIYSQMEFKFENVLVELANFEIARKPNAITNFANVAHLTKFDDPCSHC